MVIVDKWFTCVGVLWVITGLCIALGNLSPFLWDKISDGIWYTIIGIILLLCGVRYGKDRK